MPHYHLETYQIATRPLSSPPASFLNNNSQLDKACWKAKQQYWLPCLLGTTLVTPIVQWSYIRAFVRNSNGSLQCQVLGIVTGETIASELDSYPRTPLSVFRTVVSIQMKISMEKQYFHLICTCLNIFSLTICISRPSFSLQISNLKFISYVCVF